MSNLPQITNVPLPDKYISEALSNGLDKEGLLRLRAVEEAVRVSLSTGYGSPENFEKLINKIYNFYVKVS